MDGSERGSRSNALKPTLLPQPTLRLPGLPKSLLQPNRAGNASLIPQDLRRTFI